MKNYFTEDELSCPCCGVNKFNDETLLKFNKLRHDIGRPLAMSSGYRCEAYNASKGYTQTHATGQAGDLAIAGELAFDIVSLAVDYGFTGVGIKQHGPHNTRFIHLDDLEAANKRPRPWIWSYK